MKLSADDFEETVHVAREYLQAGYSVADDARLCGDFAEVIVKIADSCVVGAVCARHYGAVHGQEAEELRAGVDQILRNTSGVRDDEAAFVLADLRKSLIFLLDRVDARDSLSFREALDVSTIKLPAEIACVTGARYETLVCSRLDAGWDADGSGVQSATEAEADAAHDAACTRIRGRIQ